MTKITIDPETRAKLHDLRGLLQICDEDGRTLGYFHPLVAHGEPRKLEIGAPLSDDELQEELLKPKTGRPLADILRDLEKNS